MYDFFNMNPSHIFVILLSADYVYNNLLIRLAFTLVN